MKQDRYFRSLCFWSMGLRYLHLVRVTAEQVVDAKNKTVATYWDDRTPEEEAIELDQQTKWSDARLIEPLLFNFYHGLELLLKGFVLWAVDQKLNHFITRLFESFIATFPKEQDLIKVFQKYIVSSKMSELLSDYLQQNHLSVDQFYESLRYPFDLKFAQNYEHLVLKYKGRKGLPFYQELVTDIRSLTKLSVSLGRKVEIHSEQMHAEATSESEAPDA